MGRLTDAITHLPREVNGGRGGRTEVGALRRGQELPVPRLQDCVEQGTGTPSRVKRDRLEAWAAHWCRRCRGMSGARNALPGCARRCTEDQADAAWLGDRDLVPLLVLVVLRTR